MEAMPQSWNDDRLDDLSVKVDQLAVRMEKGFERADERLQEAFERADERLQKGLERVDERVDKGFERVDRRFEQIDLRFDTMHARFDEMQRTLIRAGYTLSAALITGIVTVIAIQL